MTGTATASMLDAALAYARRGWPVFPLHTIIDGRCTCGKDCGDNAGKHPRTEHGCKDAATDDPTIRGWWTRWPHANIGITTGKASGFFVLDVDPRNNGDETLRELEAHQGPLLGTVESLTGGGGRHIFFRYPGYAVKSRAGVGLDIKADGGYIVAPGSLHKSGRRYTWEASSHPDETPIAAPPAWLLTMLTAESNSTRTAFTIPEAIREGERNATLYKLARSMKAKGLSGEAILAALQAENRAKCQPPLPDVEIESIALHATEQADRPEFAANSNGADRQASALAPEPSWPTLAPEALHGLAGEIVAAIDPHTEADPVAILLQLLCGVGNVIGMAPHFRVEFTNHPARFFLALVGETAKARKGTSLSTLKRAFSLVDEKWAKDRMTYGLSSGEGLIDAVRDPRYEKQAIKEKGRVVDYQEVLVDEGVADKRLLLVEEELASVLKVMAREGNILSPILRQAWDSGDLHPLTKSNKIVATGAHVSIIGHITKSELLRLLNETEQGNGFANRFIWVVVRRSKCLPDPEPMPGEQLKTLAEKLKKAVAFAATVGEVARDAEANEVWAATYPILSEGRPGLTGAILARAEAQVMRVALCYALLDCSNVIRLAHLNAAIALWDYSEASARFIFGDATGDTVADRILSALRAQGPISETEIYSSLFHRNAKATRIHQALEMLQRLRLASSSIIEETGGRKKTMWEATH